MSKDLEYQKWWAANSERILAQDELRHNMNMKWAFKKALSDKSDPKKQLIQFINEHC